MPRRQLLSPQTRSSLFDPPSDPASIVRFYTFPPEDLALIRRHRRPANRLGFAASEVIRAPCPGWWCRRPRAEPSA